MHVFWPRGWDPEYLRCMRFEKKKMRMNSVAGIFFYIYITLNLYGFDQDMTVIGGLYRTLLIDGCFIGNHISKVR